MNSHHAVSAYKSNNTVQALSIKHDHHVDFQFIGYLVAALYTFVLFLDMPMAYNLFI